MSFIRTIYRALRPKDTSGPWRQFAQKNTGEYVYQCGDTVIFHHNQFKITFQVHTHSTVAGSSSYEREYFRAIAAFISPDKLQMKILRQDLIASIGKFFGAQDIEVGDWSFDPEFMIKGNDREKIQLILSDKSIQKMLLEQRDEMLRLEVTDEYGLFSEKAPEGQSMLYFISEEKIKQAEQLERIKELITRFLDLLGKTNSAKPVNELKP